MHPHNLLNAPLLQRKTLRAIPSLLSFILFSLFAATASAAPAYISDDVYTFYHGGPSDQFRIVGRIRSGTAVTIISRNESTNYIQIKTPNGRTGWISADNVSSGTSMAERFPELQAQLEKSSTMVAQQAEEIARLKTQTLSLQQENQSYTQQSNALEEEIVALNRSISGMDESNLMRWFTYGGLVAFGGLVLGLLIPFFPKRRKRRDTW